MKAASLVSNSRIKIIQRNIPKFNKDECLIKVSSCGICSSDIYRAFDNGAYFYPLIMGHEFSGTIIKKGLNVLNFKVGDNVSVFPLLPCFNCESCNNKDYVTCKNYKYYGSRNDGAFCEYISVKSWNLIKLDSDIDLDDASFLEPLSVVVHGLKRMNIYNKSKFENKNVCIIGCGFLGLMLTEIIINNYSFNKISIIDRNDFKLNLIKSDKVSKINLSSETDWKNFLGSNGDNYDYVFEMSGFYKNFARSIELSKPKAKILWLGNVDSDIEFSRSLISSVLRKELNIIGTWNSNYKNKNDDWIDSLELLRKKVIKPSKFVTKYIKVEEVENIIKKMFDHKTGKKRYDYIKYSVDFKS